MGEKEGGDKGELEENGKMQEERREGERRKREERVECGTQRWKNME